MSSSINLFSLINGKKGQHTLRNVKCHITKLLPKQEGVALIFTGTKLGTKFNIKDKTSKEHQHGLTYRVVCPDAKCNEEYNGETGWQLIERVHEHGFQTEALFIKQNKPALNKQEAFVPLKLFN